MTCAGCRKTSFNLVLSLDRPRLSSAARIERVTYNYPMAFSCTAKVRLSFSLSLSLSLSLSFGFKFGGNSLRVLRSTQKREIEETRPCSAFGKSSTICRLQIEVKHIYFEFVKFAVVAILFGAPQGIYLGGSSSTSGTK